MIFLILHFLAAVIWVGGMFFASFVLRPASLETLAPPERLRLWHAVLERFLGWVWGLSFILFLTGTLLIMDQGGLHAVRPSVHAMMLVGVVMFVIFCGIYFRWFIRFEKCVTAAQWPEAGKYLQQIRWLILTNLSLGVLALIIGEEHLF